MLTKDDYNQEIKVKQKLLSEKLEQRARLDMDIAQLRQDIGSLAQLVGNRLTRTRLGQNPVMGLTDSCREALRAVDEYLTTAEVRDSLERIGFDTTPYTNILASIQTTLKRMPDVEEGDKEGKKAYKLKRFRLSDYSTKSTGLLATLSNREKKK